MAFYVGQKVEFAYDGPSFSGRRATRLKKGQIYTVAGYTGVGGVSYDGEVLPSGLLLVEITPRSRGGFDPKRFRPITERKTDISIFKAMLNPSKTEVTA